MTSLEPGAVLAMEATGAAAAAAAGPTPPLPSSTAADAPISPATTTTSTADGGATPLPPAVDTAASRSRPTLRSTIASARAGVEAASTFMTAHSSMPAAALARVDARVDDTLASFTRTLRRTRDGTTSAMVAAGGVLGGGALVAAPLAYGMCLFVQRVAAVWAVALPGIHICGCT